MSFYNSHENLKRFNQIVQSANQRIEVLNSISRLEVSVREINAPGNDVFDSQNPKTERNRQDISKAKYETDFNLLRKSSYFQSLSLDFYLNDLDVTLKNMCEVSEKIFYHYERGRSEKAAQYMAEMDRKYAESLSQIQMLREKVQDGLYQEINLSKQSALDSQRSEYVLDFFVLLTFFGVAIYGYRIKNLASKIQLDEVKHEAFYKAVNQASILVQTDKNGIIVDVNENFCNISGYSREELIGKSHRVVKSKAHSKEFFRNLWKTISSGKVWSGDIENRKKDGESYYVRTVISPFLDQNGLIEGYFAIRFDVTSQKKQELELTASQKIAKLGSWHFDFRTKEQIWSHQHYEIFEISAPQPQEQLFKLYQERIHPEDLSNLREVLKKAIEQGQDFVFDHRVILDNGSRIKYVRGIGKVNKNLQGTPISISGTCQDLTESVMIQKSLEAERSKATMNSKLASLGEMSAGVAHEINNPLAIIVGSLHILKRSIDQTEKVKSKIESISKAAHRIEKIVKGLKKFSRSSQGNTYQLESLKSLIEEVLVLVNLKSKRHSTPVSFEIEDDNFRILCDAVEIEQVLINLVNNAIDAIKNSSEKWVKINVFRKDQAIVLQVIDSGRGIDAEVESKLFQPFFTTKPVGEGTGLGLSITKGILDQHKATIQINHLHPHTCFEICFYQHTLGGENTAA